MAVGSILLAIFAVICMGLGFLTMLVPGLGALFSFGAPALALGGAIIGRIAGKRAKRAGTTSDAARTGVILNAIAFVPALLFGSCSGLCNVMLAGGDVHLQQHVSFGTSPTQKPQASAGAAALPPPPFAGAAGSPAPHQQNPAPGTEPTQDPKTKVATPPPAFPPPPLPAGPSAPPGQR